MPMYKYVQVRTITVLPSKTFGRFCGWEFVLGLEPGRVIWIGLPLERKCTVHPQTEHLDFRGFGSSMLLI